MKKLQLLIPTYNRTEDLIFNLDLLASEIRENQAQKDVGIIISDNASPDQTQENVKNWVYKNQDIELIYFRQNENVGLEPNSVKVLELADAEFVMFIGDDDFLCRSYLKFCLEVLNSQKNIGCIIPKRMSIHPSLKNNLPAIPEGGKDQFFTKGFEAMMQASVDGHQLTGILMKREGLLQDYLSSPENRTPYLFIYFTARSLFLYDSIKTSRFVTYISEGNAKDWSYDGEGLLSEVYKAFYPFQSKLGDQKVIDLIEKMTVLQYYRLGIVISKPFQSWKRLNNLLAKIKPIPGLSSRLKKSFVKMYADLILQKIGLR